MTLGWALLVLGLLGPGAAGPVAKASAADAHASAAAAPVELVAPDPTSGTHFGTAVAISGNTAIVGAPNNSHGGQRGSGAAYVFVKSGAVWTLQKKLVAPDAADGDRFGYSVALEGDTAVIGAPRRDAPGMIDAGSVYVFTRSAGVWSLQQEFAASDASADALFGEVVALSADTVAVGAPQANETGLDSGAAYVFVRGGGVWSEQQKLVGSDEQASDFFGFAVGVSGDLVAVGAPQSDLPGKGNAGAAYVFARTGTVWGEQQKLTAGDASAAAKFGASLALDGLSLLVGAPEDGAAGQLAGGVYAYTSNGAVWSAQQKLIASDAQPGDELGVWVALDGDVALAGAPGDDTAAGASAGSAYVFTRSGGAWGDQQQLQATDGATNDLFGISVGLSNGIALVGALQHDPQGKQDAGAAYVFVLDTVPPDTSIDSAPPDPSDSSSATFTFSGSDDQTPAGALTFECSLDGALFAACTSPSSYNGLAEGHHTFAVRASDQAGNTDGSPASYGWTVATAAAPFVQKVKPQALGQGAVKAKLIITGANFVNGATVSVSGNGVTVNSVSFLSSTQLTAKVTVGRGAAVGTRDVTVTNPDSGSGSCHACLTIDAGPTVSSTDPSSGARGATGLQVKIFGSDFDSGATVRFGKGVTVESRTVVSSGEIDVVITIPASSKAGSRTVTVTNPDKGIGTLAAGFTVT